MSSTTFYYTSTPFFTSLSLSLSHRNAQVRRTAAQFLSQTVEVCGAGQLLHASRDLLEKTLTATLSFVSDAAADPRYTIQQLVEIQ